MNQVIKKRIAIITVCFGAVLLMIGIMAAFEFAKEFAMRNKASQLPAYGTPARELLNKSWERVTRESDQIDKAEKLLNSGNIDLAIPEYIKALEMTKGHGYEFMVREDLSICYEKSGQYKNALRELDWLIARQPRQEVLNDFLMRKSKIQQLQIENKDNQ